MPNEGLVNVGKCAYFSVQGGVTLDGPGLKSHRLEVWGNC